MTFSSTSFLHFLVTCSITMLKLCLVQSIRQQEQSKSPKDFQTTTNTMAKRNLETNRVIGINFDDGSDYDIYYHSDIQMENFYTLNGSTGTGFFFGTISPPRVGYNLYGSPGTISCPTGRFSLISLWMTAAYKYNLTYRLDGYNKAGNLTATFLATLPSPTQPQYFESELSGFKDLERLVFSPIVDGSDSRVGVHYVAFDNIKIDITSKCFPTWSPSQSPTQSLTQSPTKSPTQSPTQRNLKTSRLIEINFDDGINSADDPYYHSDIQMENFYTLNGSDYYPGSGYDYGTISPPHVGLNGYDVPATISCPTGRFSLISLWMTPVWTDDVTYRLDGYNKAGNLVATFLATLPSPTQPQYFESELSGFKDLERLVFSSQIDGSDDHVAFDNIKIDITSNCFPPPTQSPIQSHSNLVMAIGLGAAGILLVIAGFIIYRRRQNNQTSTNDSPSNDETPEVPIAVANAVINPDEFHILPTSAHSTIEYNGQHIVILPVATPVGPEPSAPPIEN